MLNTKFEAYKVNRVIKKSGTDFTFYRDVKNELGEETPEHIDVGILRGLYHEQNYYVAKSVSDSAQTFQKKIPMILCTIKSFEESKLIVGDWMNIGTRKYKITGATDIQNWGIVCDISLEVLDNG